MRQTLMVNLLKINIINTKSMIQLKTIKHLKGILIYKKINLRPIHHKKILISIIKQIIIIILFRLTLIT